MQNMFVIFLIWCVSACTTQTQLKIISAPAGAYITERGTHTVFGQTPTVIYYNNAALEKIKDENGCYRVKGIRAQWASGVYQEISHFNLCHGNTVHVYTVQRPPLPGLQVDLEVARGVKQDATLKHNANFDAIGAAIDAMTPVPYPVPVITNCKSTVNGSTIATQCQ